MAPWWQARAKHAGTYDEHWMNTKHPRLPDDFNYRHYNVAHPFLIQPRYLKPDSLVNLRGLTPGGGDFWFRTVRLVPFVRFQFRDGREVLTRLNLDGLHMDFRQKPWRFDLTWRGWIETCPSFYRIDLECEFEDNLPDKMMPVLGLNGIEIATA